MDAAFMLLQRTAAGLYVDRGRLAAPALASLVVPVCIR
jgi:hypothetical protein